MCQFSYEKSFSTSSFFFFSLTFYQLWNTNLQWVVGWLAGWLKMVSSNSPRPVCALLHAHHHDLQGLSSPKDYTPERVRPGTLGFTGSWAVSRVTRTDWAASMAQWGETSILDPPSGRMTEQATPTFWPYIPLAVNGDKKSIFPIGCSGHSKWARLVTGVVLALHPSLRWIYR